MNEINKNNLAVRNTLYARTLGTLEILYNGEPWELPMSVKGKVMQLFLLLIWAGESGISRVKLSPGRVGGAKDWSFVGVKAVWRRVKDIWLCNTKSA